MSPRCLKESQFCQFCILILSQVNMKVSVFVILPTLSLAFSKVSYNGAKALRIPVGEDVEPLMRIIDELSLPVWKGVANGVPVSNGHVDLVVPAAQLARFNNITATMGMETEVMHDDLGLSIAEEGQAVGFASTSTFNNCRDVC